MKPILISIKPKWVAKILNGEKTIEIRKSYPKCDLPIDVYIYCTKDLKSGKQALTWLNEKSLKQVKNITYNGKEVLGKVVAKFTLNKVDRFEYETCSTDISGYWLDNGQMFNFKKTCLSYEELFHYIKSGVGYAWHISNLVIFDKPKELSEFRKLGYAHEVFALESHIMDIEGCDGGINKSYVKKCYEELDKEYQITKAPQSYCYVEALL